MPVIEADVEKEYIKNKDLKREDVKALREWLDKQPHLPKINDLSLILFLKRCKYNNEIAKTRIDNYYTIRTHCEIFNNMDVNNPGIRRAMDIGLITLLPKLTPDGYHVIYTKMMDNDPTKYVHVNQTRLCDMYCTLQYQQNGSTEGTVLIHDMSGDVFEHTLRMDFVMMKKYLHYLQVGFPYRAKSVHFINVTPTLERLVTLIKPLIRNKLLQSTYVHKTIETLFECVPQECLPEEFGGNAGSLEKLHEQMKSNLLENGDFFRRQQKELVDESKRPGTPKSENDFFGTEGTFKKLNID